MDCKIYSVLFAGKTSEGGLNMQFDIVSFMFGAGIMLAVVIFLVSIDFDGLKQRNRSSK